MELRRIYKELCKYSHTASLAHMSGIGSLQYFPAFDKKSFDEWVKLARVVMENEVTCLLHISPRLYLDSHYKLREVLDIGIANTAIRLEIMGKPSGSV